MTELLELILQNKPIQIVLSMIVVTVIGTIVYLIAGKWIQGMKRSDDDLLFDCARGLGCSEYDIFCKSGEKWNFSDSKIQEDFRNYLLRNELPFYVRDFLKNKSRILSDQSDEGPGD